jgi:hypothetical protein
MRNAYSSSHWSEDDIKVILQKLWGSPVDSSHSEPGVGGSCEFGNEISNFLNILEFPDQLSDHQLLK